MRVKMLRTVEPKGLGGVRFEKGAHVDVSEDQAKAWMNEEEPACVIDEVPGHMTPAVLNLTGEKLEAAKKAKAFDKHGVIVSTSTSIAAEA